MRSAPADPAELPRGRDAALATGAALCAVPCGLGAWRQAALAVKSDLDETHRNLGIVRWRQGRLDDARRHFDEAVRIRPDFWNGQWTRAAFLLPRGRPGAVFEAYTAAGPSVPTRVAALAQARAAELGGDAGAPGFWPLSERRRPSGTTVPRGAGRRPSPNPDARPAGPPPARPVIH